MYFDNYLKNNPNLPLSKYQPTSISNFNHQQIPNYQSSQPNNKSYFNSKYIDYSQNNAIPTNKNFQESFYQPKPMTGYHGNITQKITSIQPQYPNKNNNTSFNQQVLNNTSNYNRENNQILKRRDSISFNNGYKPSQPYSPTSGNKNFLAENTGGISNNKSYIRSTIGNQSQKSQKSHPQTYKNLHINTENSLNSAPNINLPSNSRAQQNFNTNAAINCNIQNTKKIKDYSQQKFLDKIGYSKFISNQISLNENKSFTNKSFSLAIGSNGSEQNDKFAKQSQGLPFKKSQTYLKYHQKQSISVAQNNPNNNSNNDFMYKYQLKNMNVQLNSFTNSNNAGSGSNNAEINNQSQQKIPKSQYRYFTPLYIKEVIQKQQTVINILKNDNCKVIDSQVSQNNIKNYHNPFDYQKNQGYLKHQKQNNLTDREFHKSPSYDALFMSSTPGKQQKIQNNLQNQRKMKHQGNHQNKSPKKNQIKHYSQTNINEDVKNKVKASKNYYALIQNLQKKFSEQKKSSQSFEVKQKSYVIEINKRQQKIKKLQNILENNKQTMTDMDKTIRQLNKKVENAKNSQNSTNNSQSLGLKDLQFQQLKRQNFKLKQQIKKQRKQSGSFTDTLDKDVKQISEKSEDRIIDLQKKLSEVLTQANKLRQANSNLHQEYNAEIKQNSMMKQQLDNLKKIRQQETLNIKIYKDKSDDLLAKHNQTKAQLKLLQQKYEISLSQLSKQKAQLLTQISNQKLEISQQYQKKIQRQRSILYQTVQQQKKEKQATQQQLQKIKTKMQRLQAQINFKTMKLKTLETRLIQKQIQHQNKSSQKNEDLIKQNDQSKCHSLPMIYMQQLETIKQKLRKRQQVNEQLAQQLKSKTRLFQRMIFQKGELQSKLQKLEGKVKSLRNVETNNLEEVKDSFQSTQKNSDNNDERTYSPLSKQNNDNFKDILELLDLYHEKYRQIAAILNLNEQIKSQLPKQQSQMASLTCMPHQDVQQSEICNHLQSSPSKQYLTLLHPLVKEQIQKVNKDLKKLVGVLKQLQTESQQKNQKLYQADKSLKKQGNKINSLMGEIHMKNIAILEINKMQMQKQIIKLNQKYQILMNVEIGQTQQ